MRWMVQQITATDPRCIYDNVNDARFAVTVSILLIIWKGMFLTRIIIDPLLNYAMDRRLRSAILNILQLQNKTEETTGASAISSMKSSFLKSKEQPLLLVNVNVM
jgi:hypothetical protein